VQNPFLKDPELFIRQKNFREHIYLDSGEYASYLREEWNETFVEIKYHNSLLRNRMLNELLNETVPILVHEEDLNAMNASLENRSPYLDRDLVNFMGSVPTKWMVQNGMAKAVLRESVRGVAPNFIINNPRKIGFNVPIEDMLDLRLKSNRDVIFSDSILFDIIDRTKLREIIQNSNLSNSKSKFIFSFISTKLFLDTLI
jgi:asparagine synthase (glutamine-hydrolysing)